MDIPLPCPRYVSYGYICYGLGYVIIWIYSCVDIIIISLIYLAYGYRCYMNVLWIYYITTLQDILVISCNMDIVILL